MMKINWIICLLVALFQTDNLRAQDGHKQKEMLDSLYIDEIEQAKGSDKVLHAEPLFIDLIRDLGARKGEREWNIGTGLTDNIKFDEYTALVEYEWAPVNRLGLEIELPFTLYYPTKSKETPGSKLNSIKLAGQYTFYVSELYKTSMAIGYIQELELTNFRSYSNSRFWQGNVYNPFFVAAKRWGKNFHTLLYTGPQIVQHFSDNHIYTIWGINSNVHYMIPGTRNFIGIEFNKTIENNDFDMTIRPQMRVSVSDNLLIGIVTGVPINREQERFSTFIRLIYEPHSRKH